MVSRRHRFAPVGCDTVPLGRELQYDAIDPAPTRARGARHLPAARPRRRGAAGANPWVPGVPSLNPIAGWHALGPVLLSVTAVAGFGTGDAQRTGTGNAPSSWRRSNPASTAAALSLLLAHWLRCEGGGILRATALRFWSGSPDAHLPRRERRSGSSRCCRLACALARSSPRVTRRAARRSGWRT